MDAGDPFGYVSYERGHRAAVDSAEVEPDGFASPAHCQARSPGTLSSEDGTGTPKAPLLAFEARPGKPCPGAPRKGKAPFSHFDLSGEAPVRRLSFGTNGSQSTEQDLDSDSCSMDEDDCMEEQEPEEQQQQQQPQQVVQQQYLRRPPPQLMQQHMQQPWQQQLMGPALPSPQQLFRQQLVQQLQPLRPPQPPCSQLWGSQPQQPAQQAVWNPLSPTGARPPPLAPSGLPPGSTTPVRLFR